MSRPAIPVLTRAQVREVDRRAIQDYGMSGLVLMENAGRGAADFLCRLLTEARKPSGPVAIVCGRGNNGGDGLVIARHLDLRGVSAKVLLVGDGSQLSGEAAANFSILERAGLPIEKYSDGFDAKKFAAELAGAAYLVDALLGTGASGEPKTPVAEAINLMNVSGIPILAIDLPSGLDCDTGMAAIHTIRATHTCTFVAAKPGLLAPGAGRFVGQLRVADIGVPRRLIEEIETT